MSASHVAEIQARPFINFPAKYLKIILGWLQEFFPFPVISAYSGF
jgi:hypothetical protein